MVKPSGRRRAHCEKGAGGMIKKVSVLLMALGCVSLGATGHDSLATFDGGIGVLPVSNVVVNA